MVLVVTFADGHVVNAVTIGAARASDRAVENFIFVYLYLTGCYIDMFEMYE